MTRYHADMIQSTESVVTHGNIQVEYSFQLFYIAEWQKRTKLMTSSD